MKQLITLSEYFDDKISTGYDFPYGADYIEKFNISCVTVHCDITNGEYRYILIDNRLVYVLESIDFGQILCLDEKYFDFRYNIKFEEFCLKSQLDVPFLCAWNVGCFDAETALDIFLDDFDRYFSESEKNKKNINIQTFSKTRFYLKKTHREMYEKHISENKLNK